MIIFTVRLIITLTESVAWRLNTAKMPNPQKHLFDVVGLCKFVQRSSRIKEMLSELLLGPSSLRARTILKDILDPIERNLNRCNVFVTYVTEMVDIELVERIERDNWRSLTSPIGPGGLVGAEELLTDERSESCDETEEDGIQSEIYTGIGGSTCPGYGTSGSPTGWGGGDSYDRFNKRTWVRIKPSISTELTILDEAYRKSLRELESECKRIHTCLAGLNVRSSTSTCWSPMSPLDRIDPEVLPCQSKKRRLGDVDGPGSEVNIHTPESRKKCAGSSVLSIAIEKNNNNEFHLRMKKKDRHLVIRAMENASLRAAGVDISLVTTSSKNGVIFTTKQVQISLCVWVLTYVYYAFSFRLWRIKALSLESDTVPRRQA